MAVPQASAGVPPRGTAWSVPADTAAIQFPTITAFATAYGHTVFVDASTGRVAWLVSRDACRRAVQSFVPGPGRWG